jgi:polyhydroxyalkanoate synthase
MSSIAALPLLRNGSHDWKLSSPLETVLEDVNGLPLDGFGEAVTGEILARLDRLLAGIERYRAHPYHRDLADPPALWTEGTTRLLDYGATAPGKPPGRPVLFVPSLVNRAYILDLSPRRSFLRWLPQRGVRPLLVDWGAPGETEQGFDLTDYIAGRLARALDAARAVAGPAPMPVVGYCMGGLLAVALAQLRPEAVGGLVLLATPWDFHAENGEMIRARAAALEGAVPLIERWGEMPVDMLQALFAGLDPLLAARKFDQFLRLDPDSPQAESFVALEDWLNDGVPLTAPVAVACIGGWYGCNTPARREWQVAGTAIDPGRLACPSLHLIPAHDRIVPPGSARALADAMPGSDRLEPTLGHIGMMVGGSARGAAWEPIADWLAARC